MASSRILAVLLAGFALTALAGDCDPVKPEPECTPVKPGLTPAQIAGIAVGTVAGVGVIAGGVTAGVKHANQQKDKDAASEDAEPEIHARAAPAGPVVPPPAAPVANATTTTTMTALDSSASSDSDASSGSLKSFGSGPAGSSSFGDSFNTGSSASDSFGSASSGSTASGSWGSQLQIWQWILLLALCCCCLAGGGAASMGGGKKRSKKKSKAKPAPVAEEVEPLMAELPPLMPLGTSSLIQPSYSMMAAPMTTAYAPQVQYAPQYAPQVQYAYEQAPVAYATAPAVGAYGTTAFAAPPAYAYAPAAGYAVQAPVMEVTTGQPF